LDSGDIYLTVPDPVGNAKGDSLHSVSKQLSSSDYVHMGIFVRQYGERSTSFKRHPTLTVPPFAPGQLQIVESTLSRNGVWCYSMEAGLTKTAILDDYIMVRKLQGVERTREWRARLEKVLEKYVGTPFDGGELGAVEMLNASRKSPRMTEEYEKHGKVQRPMTAENEIHRHYFFCSELVSTVFQAMNLLPEGPDVRSDFFTPGSYSVAHSGTVDKLLAMHGSGASLGPEMLLRYPGGQFELNLRKIASLRAHTEFLDPDALART